MEAMTWARQQFWGATLCDLRLQRRLVEVAACIRENPRGTLPRALGEPMALKGAYRLLGNPKVTHERVLEPHIIATRDKCRGAGDYLIIEDTTALSFTQRGAAKGMGPLTQPSSQGFLVHTPGVYRHSVSDCASCCLDGPFESDDHYFPGWSNC